MTVDALSGGFADAVLQSQAVFRSLLDVLSRPGSVAPIGGDVRPPRPLNAAAAAILCAIADEETPVFLDFRLGGHEAVGAWIRFHTGARLVGKPAEAAFAVIADAEAMPPLAEFRQGSDQYPDRSATLILQVESLSQGLPLLLEGPGIDGTARMAPQPFPSALVEQLRANRRVFPRGVDLVLAAPNEIAGLPRSTRVLAGGGR